MGFLDSIKWPLGKPGEGEYNEDYDSEYDDPETEEEETQEESEPAEIKEGETEESAPETSTGSSLLGSRKKTTKSTGKVVNMQAGKAQAEKENKSKRFEIKVFKLPKEYHNFSEIAEALLKGKAVILNLEDMEISGAQSVIDFVTGACFTMDGDLKKISKRIFIATPNDGKIDQRDGDLQTNSTAYPSDISMMDMNK